MGSANQKLILFTPVSTLNLIAQLSSWGKEYEKHWHKMDQQEIHPCTWKSKWGDSGEFWSDVNGQHKLLEKRFVLGQIIMLQEGWNRHWSGHRMLLSCTKIWDILSSKQSLSYVSPSIHRICPNI